MKALILLLPCLFLSYSSSVLSEGITSGLYKMFGDSKCQIAIKIGMSKQKSVYDFSTPERHQQGELRYSEKDNSVTFLGLYADDTQQDVSAIYDDRAFIFQNYGMSSNDYHLFTECGGKYLLLEHDGNQ